VEVAWVGEAATKMGTDVADGADTAKEALASMAQQVIDTFRKGTRETGEE
jgi:hypothetical protein